MSRRFLYMVVRNDLVDPLSYTLHRINPSRLFYPKDSPERAAAAAAAGARATTVQAAAAARWKTVSKNSVPDIVAEKARLSRPTMTFSSPSEYMNFALTRRNKDQIDRANRFRTGEEGCVVDRGVLYDDASHSVVALPGLTFPQHGVVPVAVGDDLYFVGVEEDDRRVDNNGVYCYGYDSRVSRDHRLFVQGLTRELDRYQQYPVGYWYSFPPPSYLGLGHAGQTRNHHSYEVACCAVVGQDGGWCIWASMRDNETYSLNTQNGEWSQVCDSRLPFRGPAVYAPEHGLWFGFPYEEHYYDSRFLGAWDLHTGADAPVQARGVWEGFTHAKPYYSRSYLVHLGDGGRFCVAKLFEETKPPPARSCPRCYYDCANPPEMGFAVLTGVEVERCDGGELRMIKHRSRKYSLGEYKSAHALL